MKRTLVTAISQLTEAQRAKIAAAASAHGFEALFFEDERDALDALEDAEIAFGGSELLARRGLKLRWLCTPSAGVNQFTAPGTFTSPDAVLTNSSGAYGVTIAEHIVMVTLQVMRRQPEYAEMVRNRVWERGLAVRSIRDSRVTLLGTGDIGREAAIRLRSFSPACLVGVNRSGHNPASLFDRAAPESELDALLPETDLLVVSLPGTLETFHMLDARRLSLLPDGAIVVNVGRGSIIDQAAMLKELQSCRLSAALDVFETEPLPPDDPMWTCPNLVLTQHTAGNMTLPYTVNRIVSLFLEDFENYCQGKPLKRQVNLEKGY